MQTHPMPDFGSFSLLLALIFFFVLGTGLVLGQNQAAQPWSRWQWFKERETSVSRHLYLIADTAKEHAIGKHEYGSNARAFGYMLASREGQRLVSNSTELLFGSLFKENPRYRPLRTGGIPRRFWHATYYAFTAHTDDGRARLSYSRAIAVTVGVVAANAWRPNGKGVGGVASDAAFAISGKVFDNLFDEFMSRPLSNFGGKVVKKTKKIFHISTLRPPTATNTRSGVSCLYKTKASCTRQLAKLVSFNG